MGLAAESMAQNRVQFTASSKATAKTTQTATARKVSQVSEAEEVPTGPSEGDQPGEYVPTGAGYGGLTPGYAYGPLGPYGYRPDFGYVNGNMSAWPGVPACCDPWFGYCGEPRCYPCACGQGRYMYYHCPHGGCGPELLTWQKGDLSCKGGQPSAMCYGKQGCTTCGPNAGCAKCRSTSYSPGGSQSPTVITPEPTQPVPEAAPALPRNDLPTTPAQPSARRRTGMSTT